MTATGTLAAGDTLSQDERRTFEECIETIDRGFKVWYEVGKALLKINNHRLYREEHSSFEKFVAERWGLKRPRAYELMGASQVFENVSEISDTPPRYESHAANLIPLPPAEQRLVWGIVQETAPGGKVTAAHVKSITNVLTEIVSTGAIDDGTGQSIPVKEASIDHLKAAVVEETYERMQRQESHIKNADKPRPRRIWKGKMLVAMDAYLPAALILSDPDIPFQPSGIEEGKTYMVTFEEVEP